MIGEIAVLTPTVDTRWSTLIESVATVAGQTRRPAVHSIGYDRDREGGARTLNRLGADLAPWIDYVCVVPDDDLLAMNHLSVCAGILDERPDVDVVSTWCVTTGRPFAGYNVDELDRGMVQRSSCVAHTAMFRAKWIADVGGWQNKAGYDWLFWKDLAAAGAAFHVEPQLTWTYRLDGGNESWGETP